jgi:hypothetical protein
MNQPCAYEELVVAAAVECERPAPHVVSHLSSCASCREVAALTAVLRDERDEALVAARVPSAGVVWWRAERRARLEAAQVAARPITVATGLAIASAIGVLASLAGALAWWWRTWLDVPVRLGQGTLLIAEGLSTSPSGLRLALWLAAGALLLATPVAWYVATRDDR